VSKVIKFGIIGCGLMGKEFASASARWCHLSGDIPRPQIVGVCDTNKASHQWFTDNFPGVVATTDYKELLARPDIEAIYCALPHVLHEQVYIDVIEAGKHLLGEKPFGMDQKANTRILTALAKHPEIIVRCASEFPFFPACQMLIDWIQKDKFGQIIEVKAGFNHASDLDVTKPINWKRQKAINGEYGCLGDLGIHTQHVPFRVGWVPKSVFGVFSDIVKTRPDGKGGTVPCDTYDNATLVCQCEDKHGREFPMYLETLRLQPGATNDWYLRVTGMNASAYFTTEDPNAFHSLLSEGKNQAWSRVVVGNTPMFPTITGDIFEFGFSDSILQMWAAFMQELAGAKVTFGCFTPEETRLSHALATAALKSHATKQAIPLVL